MKPKHTKGPWRIVPSRFGFGIRSDVTNLCQVSALDGHEATDADARLIAAAPEMLEALESLPDYLIDDRELAYRIRCAIKKARGES